MLILQDVSYRHPNKDLLLDHIDLIINQKDKIALLGNNGVGKSTLLKIMAGILRSSAGDVKVGSKPYYVPQIFGQYNDHTVGQALGITHKLQVLREILDGQVTDANLSALDDDWNIEERCSAALSHWKMEGLDLNEKIGRLSGGQKTKVFLAGIMVHEAETVLLDEPSNHLDAESRAILYDYIKSTSNTLVVVSHDRKLLALLNTVYELSKGSIKRYGGNYDFYVAQKEIESKALDEDIRNKEKVLRKAKETEREVIERQQKLDARGKKKQEKAGAPTISMNTLRNNAEKSTSRARDVHAEKVNGIAGELNSLRKERTHTNTMKIDFDNSALHRGKALIIADELNMEYGNEWLWAKPVSFQIVSGERMSISGRNGSGKTTLIKIMLGKLQAGVGKLWTADIKAVYIDQDYSLIDNKLSVYEQAQSFNYLKLAEHEVKIQLSRFLFTKDGWNNTCINLSGGEKMRLALCCLSIWNKAPDMIVLDEPTNNLDIQNVRLLTAAINEYEGTLIVVSHDVQFLEEVHVGRMIRL